MATRISVIVPCFNAARFLQQAVESLLQTNYPELEIIVVDDGSNDGSWDIAHEIAATHHNLKVIAHPNHENRGAGCSRNLGVEHSTGAYIAFLDADDYVYQNRFAGPAAILDQQPDVDAVCGTTEKVVESGGEERSQYVRERTVFDCEEPERVLERRLFGHLAWSTNAILLRRSAFERAGGFSHRRIAQDAVLWLKLACVARIVSAGPDPICVYRIHARNTSSAVIHKRFRPVNSLVILEALQWTRTHPIRDEYQSLLIRALVSRTMSDNRRLREARTFTRAIGHLCRVLLQRPDLIREPQMIRAFMITVLESCRLRKPAFVQKESAA